MRIHLIKRKTAEEYAKRNPVSRRAIDIWLTLLKYAEWEKPSDIMATYRKADILGNGSNRVVFNVGGNKFRIIGKYIFGREKVHLFICWIGTHSEYDLVCKRDEQYTINWHSK